MFSVYLSLIHIFWDEWKCNSYLIPSCIPSFAVEVFLYINFLTQNPSAATDWSWQRKHWVPLQFFRIIQKENHSAGRVDISTVPLNCLKSFYVSDMVKKCEVNSWQWRFRIKIHFPGALLYLEFSIRCHQSKLFGIVTYLKLCSQIIW